MKRSRHTEGNRKLATLCAVALAAIVVLALPSMAAAKHRDRNHDRIPDRWEKRHNLSLAVNQAGRDQDGDQLTNRGEFLAGDNPRNADSDGDGIPDGEENAGKIQSFDPASGRLVIALFSEETVSGLVTEATEIECGHGSASASDMGSGGDEGEDGLGEHEGGEEGDDDHAAPGEAGDNEGGEEEPGDDEAGEHGGMPGVEGEHGACTTADLTEGAVVKEAELKLEGGSASFEKVELAG
jgi:hypothetical protein